MNTFESYSQYPKDIQTLISLCNDLSSSGQHEVAMLFYEEALRLSPTAEELKSLRNAVSISGFYSKVPNRIKAGKIACEEIALDKENPWYVKNQARQNSTFYARSAKDIMPSTTYKEVEFNLPPSYKAMNPSITSHNDELFMIQRTVNYLIRPDGSYDMQGDIAIRTRNFLVKLDHNLSTIGQEEILPPIDLPDPAYIDVIGFEDCRLFFWNNEPWCTCTVRELNPEGNCEIVLSKIIRDGNDLRFSDFEVIRPKFCPMTHEKNWMPMVVGSNLHFVYSCDPTRIINREGELLINRVSHIAADSFRGGSQLVDFEDGWLAIIHESHNMPNAPRRYMHRFVLFDMYGRLSKFTEAFYIKDLGIEFAAGMALNPSTNEIIISFGIKDRESWLASFNINEIKKNLRPAGLPLYYLPTDQSGMAWLNSQTNQTLLSSTVVKTSKDILQRAILPWHSDGPKNWDNLIAIWNTVLTTESVDPIMDIGATPESAFLPSLSKLGYKNLIGIDLVKGNTEVIDGITYQQGDCTATNFPNDYFGFIACLSVIEHGVDIDKFLQESYRILKPGGYLSISTDYWKDKIDTFGQYAFGAPVKVFDAPSIKDLIEKASKIGLHMTGAVNLDCNEKVVNWIGMDYTFINFLLCKS